MRTQRELNAPDVLSMHRVSFARLRFAENKLTTRRLHAECKRRARIYEALYDNVTEIQLLHQIILNLNLPITKSKM